MPFQLSPGVNTTEIDLTTVIPAVATTDGAIAGVFQWGPVDKPVLVTGEDDMVAQFGKPNAGNFETFMTAASFLSYSNSLYISRAHHSFGSDIRLSVFTVDGADYFVVADSDSTGVSTGDVVAARGSDVAEAVVTVDASDQVEAITQTNIDTVGNKIDQTLTVLREGEKVTATSDNALPTVLGGGTGPSAELYVINVNAGDFQLTTSQGSTGDIVVFGDTGSGTMTLTRSGSTRITMTGETFSGGTGSTILEFHDADYSFNAVANSSVRAASLASNIVKNEDTYDGALASFDDSVEWIAKYPGSLGNSLQISVCDSANAFSSTVTVAQGAATVLAIEIGASNGTITTDGADSLITDVTAQLAVGDKILVGNTTIGEQYLEISGIDTTSNTSSGVLTFTTPLTTTEDVSIASTAGANATFTRLWQHWDLVDGAPGTSEYVAEKGGTGKDQVHVVVLDEDGLISGVPGTVLEVFNSLSRATDAKDEQGSSLYYKDAINSRSQYVWWANDRTGAASAPAISVASSTNNDPSTLSFASGRDNGTETSAPLGDILRAYDVFKSAEDVDISLVMAGKARGGAHGQTLPNYIVDNIAESRKDCVVFISPERGDVVDNVSDIAADVVEFRNACRSTSYGVLDGGYKYMYDKYNDVYRWVPLNGDIAGLAAYTDGERDAWWSPAGFNRGQIRNVVRLAWNPKKAQRDLLYKNGVNPVVNFPGQGVVLFGDKTMLARPSAFDRINVRRLFIVLEKAIATASQSTLFEFNDEFTRASFVNLVTPFLRSVQGRRGITDFVVVCDGTNNTGDVIDRNEFVGDIYVKPSRSINFIQLNFVAVRSGVEFSEVIGNA